MISRRRPLDRTHRQPRGGARLRQGVHVLQHGRACRRPAALFERHRPEVVFHLAAQAGRAPLARGSGAGRQHQHHGHAQRAGAARSKVGVRKVIYAASGGTIYGEPEARAREGIGRAGLAPARPYGISKKVGPGLPGLLPALPGAGFHGARARERLRAAPGPARRGGRGRDLRRRRCWPARRPSIYGDGNQTRDYVFIDDTVHAFVQAMDEGLGQARQHRHGPGDEREPPLPAARRTSSGSRRSPEHGPLPPGELRRIALDISSAPNAIAGSPGPTSRTAWPRRSRTSRASEPAPVSGCGAVRVDPLALSWLSC